MAFNPNRLRLARRRRGWSKVRLANEAKVGVRSIQVYENEGIEPSDTALATLATALRFPVEFFHLPDPPRAPAASISFRSARSLTAGRRDAAIEAASLAFELGDWLDARYTFPAPDVPDLSGLRPEDAAIALRTEWALGNRPAPNMIQLLEVHGVRVFSLVDDCAALDAFSVWHGERPHVFVTQHKSPEKDRWTAAHELGHVVLHRGEHDPAHEAEADTFAGHFLLPRGGFLATAQLHCTLADVRRQKLTWRVSAIAYIRALRDVMYISDWEYRNLVIEASQAGLRSEEGDISRDESAAIPKLVEMLREDGITIRRLADELSMNVDDVRGLLFNPPALIGGGVASSPRRRGHLRVVN